jgi:NUMOD4 motif-containing protein
MTESWRPLPGHSGHEISDLGRVRSIDRTFNRICKCGPVRARLEGRVLAMSTANRAYPRGDDPPSVDARARELNLLEIETLDGNWWATLITRYSRRRGAYRGVCPLAQGRAGAPAP